MTRPSGIIGRELCVLGKTYEEEKINAKSLYGLYCIVVEHTFNLFLINVGRGDDGFDMRKIVFRMARPS
jgi:hypothetical protein